MGILNFLFGKNKDLQKKSTHNQVVDIFVPTFSGGASPKLNDTYMACCQAHARHGSKFKPIVYLGDSPAEAKKSLTNVLNLRPNPVMSGPTFYEKITQNYFEVNNVYIFIERDYSNYKQSVKALWPLDPDGNRMTVRKADSGEIYLRFTLDGQEKTVSIDDIIHIPRNIDAGGMFGHQNKAIDTVLKVIQTNYEGIEQAIRTSAFLRFIVQTSTPLSPKALEEKTSYFAKTYLGVDNSSGVAYLDSAENVIQVNSQAKYINDKELAFFEKKIYQYLGASDKILTATFSEDEWQSYYESSLEPLALKLEAELTYKLLTERERDLGGKIVIDANRLQSASLKTRKDVAVAYMALPVYKPNVVAELLYLPKLENGDKEYSTLNYVQADKQNKYQGVGEESAKEEESKETPKEDEEEEDDNA